MELHECECNGSSSKEEAGLCVNGRDASALATATSLNSNSGAGVMVGGPWEFQKGGEVKMQGCACNDNKGSGLVVLSHRENVWVSVSHSRATAIASSISSNHSDCVRACERGKIKLYDSQCNNSTNGCGWAAHSHATVILGHGCMADGNKRGQCDQSVGGKVVSDKEYQSLCCLLM